ncbi:MAG: 50S ribosomal protein L25 [Vulcanimicrobiaceae bacterium]
MAQQLKLAIERRDRTGSTVARKLRKLGKIPGVVYGHGSDPQPIAFDARAFEDLLHHGGRTSLITLTTDGKSADTALVRELQHDPVTHRILHADLQRVSATENVHARLPVVTVGSAKGVKDYGGVMDVIVHELEIEGPANKLPDSIEIDVTPLGIHEHVKAGDIKLPPGFKMATPADQIVVAIEPSKTAQALEEAQAPELAEVPTFAEAPEQGEGASE